MHLDAMLTVPISFLIYNFAGIFCTSYTFGDE